MAPDCDQTEGKGEIYTCQERFSLMQEQLKKCVSHHRLILEYRYFAIFCIFQQLCSMQRVINQSVAFRAHKKTQCYADQFSVLYRYCLICPFILICQSLTSQAT
jgi:hypothetical protein